MTGNGGLSCSIGLNFRVSTGGLPLQECRKDGEKFPLQTGGLRRGRRLCLPGRFITG